MGLLGATFETNNRGVSALAEGAVKTLLAAYPGARVSFFDYGRAARSYRLDMDGRRVDVDLVTFRFSRNLRLRNHILRLLAAATAWRALPLASLRRRLLERYPVLAALRACALVAAVSGGDSFSDIYGRRRFYYTVLPQLLVLMLKVKLVLLPQTYGPYRHRGVRMLARCICRRAERVYARDRASLEEVRRLAGRMPGRFGFGYDLGFVLDPRRPDDPGEEGLTGALQAGKTLIGLNASGLLWMGGYSRDNMFGLRSDYPLLMRSVARHLLGVSGTFLLIIPHVFGEGRNAESDVGAGYTLYRMVREEFPGRVWAVQNSYGHREIKHLIGTCGMFIGSRMHACIAALSQGVPTVGLAYSDKFRGVFESLGLESLVADLRTMEEREVIALIDGVLRDAGPVREQLARVTAEVRSSILEMLRPQTLAGGRVPGASGETDLRYPVTYL